MADFASKYAFALADSDSDDDSPVIDPVANKPKPQSNASTLFGG